MLGRERVACLAEIAVVCGSCIERPLIGDRGVVWCDEVD